MRLSFAPLFLLVALCACARAQAPAIDYGSTTELKGVTKIFIYTGADLKLRDKLKEKITKKLPQITVTDSIDDAEVIVGYAADAETFLSGISTHGTATTLGGSTTVHGHSRPRYQTVEYGQGIVVRRGEQGRLRLLLNWSDDKSHFWQKGLTGKFADAFIKAYLKANEGGPHQQTDKSGKG